MSEVYQVKGEVLLAKADLRGAIRQFDEAIRLDESNPVPLYNKGLTLIQKRANANKTHLVDMTEACVSHELSAFVSASLAAAKPKKDGDGDDADVGASGGAADAPAAADGTARQRRRPPGGGDGR